MLAPANYTLKLPRQPLLPEARKRWVKAAKIDFRHRVHESLLTTPKRIANRKTDEESHESMVPDRVTPGPSCTCCLDAFRV